MESNNPELRKAVAELRKLQGTEEVMRREAIASKTPDPKGPEARAAAERTLARGKAEASAMGAAGRALTGGQQAAAQAEKEYLQELKSLTREDVKEACRISMLSRSRLYELLKKHAISV